MAGDYEHTMIRFHDDGIELRNEYVDELMPALKPHEYSALTLLFMKLRKTNGAPVECRFEDFIEPFKDRPHTPSINNLRTSFRGLQEWGAIRYEKISYGVYRFTLTDYSEWDFPRLQALQAEYDARIAHETRIRNDSHLPAIRRQVFQRDGFICQYCGAEGTPDDLTLDHRIPVSRGGTNDLDNLATACRACNMSKKNKTPEEWEAWRAKRMES